MPNLDDFELEDNALDGAAGGSSYGDDGRLIVTWGNSCDKWQPVYGYEDREHTCYTCSHGDIGVTSYCNARTAFSDSEEAGPGSLSPA